MTAVFQIMEIYFRHYQIIPKEFRHFQFIQEKKILTYSIISCQIWQAV